MTKSECEAPTAPHVQQVEVAAIIKDPAFQMRTRLDANHVKTLHEAYKNGANVEPVKLADIEGSLYVIDGFHRLEAIGIQGTVSATIERMDSWEALERAARANLTNALQLKPRERTKALRTMLKAYIRSGKHIATKGTRRFGKSFREIAADLGGQVSHETVRQWIRRHHNAIYERWWGTGEEPRSADFEGDKIAPLTSAELALEEFATAAVKMLEAFQRVTDPRMRGEAIAQWEDFLNLAKKSGSYTQPEF